MDCQCNRIFVYTGYSPFHVIQIVAWMTSFICISRINLPILRSSLDRLKIFTEAFWSLLALLDLGSTKLADANKTSESVTTQKLGPHKFWQIANKALNKDKFAISPPSNCLQILLFESDMAKLFAENIKGKLLSWCLKFFSTKFSI